MRHLQLYSLVNRRQHRKLAAMQSLRRRLARASFGCAAVLMLTLVVFILGVGISYVSLVNDLPSLAQVPELLDPESGLLMQPTRVYDRSGQKLLLSLENPGISRRYLPLDPGKADHFSPELTRVTVGALDANFWSSPGFSLEHIFNSQPYTIPERLVDDLLLWKEPAGLRRALRMRLLSAQLVARYGHVQVLEWYLNSAAYGHMAYGADSAARLYLGKPATSVDLPEAALLIAVGQAPALNPLDAPSAALEQQQILLKTLQERGIITAKELERALAEPMPLAADSGPEASPASAFSHLALDKLAERFGRERLERGGLRIITTLDYDLQLELTCLSRTQLARLEGGSDEIKLPDGSACQSARLLPTLPPGDSSLSKELAASGVIFDPQTGQVLALLGDTTLSGESILLSSRAPGSVLSPFVALTAFARGYSPASLSWDIPASLPDDLAARTSPDGKFHGPVRLRTALANDYMAPLAQLLTQMGAPEVWRQASALGLNGVSEERSAEILYRGGNVSALELAQAYGVFAAQGVRAGQHLLTGGDLQPSMILYVEDSAGAVWFDGRQPEKQALISPPLAYLAHHILSDDTARWPSLGYPNALEIGRPSAAKIGRVEGGKQLWAAGYTPQRVVIFSLNLPESSGKEQLNPRMAAGMWHAMMQYATRSQPADDWAEPSGLAHVEVCNPSGQLPTSSCPEVVSEVFLTGNEPTAADTLFSAFQINRETGRLATVFTPPALVEEKTFMVVPSLARAWAQTQNLPVPPQDYDAIQPAAPSADARITSPELFAYIHGQVAFKGSAAGDGFTSYQLLAGQGLNPKSWLQIGSDGTTPIVDGDLGVWDTSGLEGLYAIRLLVVRQDQAVETATIQVTVDNTAPLARIPYPINGQVFKYPQERMITFQAEANDAIGVQRLVWQVDGKQVGESLQGPYVFTWQADKGEHVLVVQAYDEAGNEGKSEEVRFSVK